MSDNTITITINLNHENMDSARRILDQFVWLLAPPPSAPSPTPSPEQTDRHHVVITYRDAETSPRSSEQSDRPATGLHTVAAERSIRMRAQAEHQPPPPAAAPAAGVDLIGGPAICQRYGFTSSTLVYYRQHGFPQPVTKRGNALLYDVVTVADWLTEWNATHPGHGPPAKTAPSDDACASCADYRRVGRNAICGSESSLYRHEIRGPSQICSWHRKPGPADYHPPTPDVEDSQ